MEPVKKLWQKFGGRSLLISLGLHLVLIAVAGFWVITELIPSQEKVFTASASTGDAAVKQVEHRVQLARRAGSSGGSQLSAQRITGSAESSFSMPELPETANVGLGAISGGGFGTGGFGLGSGSGSGFGVGTGGTAGTMRDVMSIFGAVRINAKNEKVVFLIDVSDHMMTPRKGGFEAYGIVREEMIKLVTRLPLSVRFNAIMFDGGSIHIFRTDGVVPANAASKEAFVAWFSPINQDASRRGAGGNNWRRKNPRTEVQDDGTKTDFISWEDVPMRALTAAFEMQPDSIYMLTGRTPRAHFRTLTNAQLEREKNRTGDTEEVSAARGRAYAQAQRELEAINQTLRQQGKSPIIIPEIWTIENEDNQRAFRSAGVQPIRLVRDGWERNGRLIAPVLPRRDADANELLKRLRELQELSGGARPKLNFTLLLGPDDPQDSDREALGRIARGFQGRMNTIDFKDLQSLQRASSR